MTPRTSANIVLAADISQLLSGLLQHDVIQTVNSLMAGSPRRIEATPAVGDLGKSFVEWSTQVHCKSNVDKFSKR